MQETDAVPRRYRKAKLFLQAVMSGEVDPTDSQMKAAIALLPYQASRKPASVKWEGKKARDAENAQRLTAGGGRKGALYAIPAPPVKKGG